MAKPIAVALLLLLGFLSVTPPAHSLCSDSIITSLSLSGFTHFAHALHSHNLTATATATTTRPTCFVAPDSAFLGRPLSSTTVRAHIHASAALPFRSLLQLQPNTALPTLHRTTTLLLGSDGERVSVNGVLVTAPNLHVDDSCVVHGVAGPLIDADHHDHPTLPRTKISLKPKRFPKHLHRRFAEVVKFIRRAHGPILGDDYQNRYTSLP